MGFPAATPVTTPVEASTVANPVLELDHTPPDVPFVNVMVDPTHTDDGPEIAATTGRAVTVIVALGTVIEKVVLRASVTLTRRYEKIPAMSVGEVLVPVLPEFIRMVWSPPPFIV